MEVKLAQEESSRWRARTQQLLEKYDRIDPVEFQQLKDAKAELGLNLIQSSQQADDLRKEIESLGQKMSTIEQETLKKSQEDLSKKSEELQQQIDKFKRVAQNWKSKHDTLQRDSQVENEVRTEASEFYLSRKEKKACNTFFFFFFFSIETSPGSQDWPGDSPKEARGGRGKGQENRGA